MNKLSKFAGLLVGLVLAIAPSLSAYEIKVKNDTNFPLNIKIIYAGGAICHHASKDGLLPGEEFKDESYACCVHSIFATATHNSNVSTSKFHGCGSISDRVTHDDNGLQIKTE